MKRENFYSLEKNGSNVLENLMDRLRVSKFEVFKTKVESGALTAISMGILQQSAESLNVLGNKSRRPICQE